MDVFFTWNFNPVKNNDSHKKVRLKWVAIEYDNFHMTAQQFG